MPIYRTYNRDFFKKWSHDMSYVLGFLFADGNLVQNKRGGHYIAIYTADRPLLVAMKRSMESTHVISVQHKPLGSAYRIQIGSKEWFQDLHVLCLTPNKTRRMHLPSIPKKYVGDFVRGYFDGDGNVWMGRIHKDRPVQSAVLQACFTSASLDFLKSLLELLRNNGIRGGGFYTVKKGTYSRLILSTLDALKLYEIMYNATCKLHLERKKSVFERFANKRSLLRV